MTSVLQDWVTHLPLMQQSVLLCSLRGVDGISKENYSKNITRRIRQIVCVDAKPQAAHSFMSSDNKVSLWTDVQKFIQDIDPYPMHFVLHLLYAIEIIGYKHPDDSVRNEWIQAYKEIVDAIHLNPETEAELDRRLCK